MRAAYLVVHELAVQDGAPKLAGGIHNLAQQTHTCVHNATGEFQPWEWQTDHERVMVCTSVFNTGAGVWEMGVTDALMHCEQLHSGG